MMMASKEDLDNFFFWQHKSGLLMFVQRNEPQSVVRTMTQRGAIQWAIQFSLDNPGSMGLIFGVTRVSLMELVNGRNGLRHCLSDRMINDIETRWTGVRFPNGSRILGFTPSANDVQRLDGLNINYVVVEQDAPYRHREAWEALTRRIRPLPGFENCIITITDDEADE